MIIHDYKHVTNQIVAKYMPLYVQLYIYAQSFFKTKMVTSWSIHALIRFSNSQ